MVFERSFDYPLLNSLLTRPSIFPFLGDDFAPEIEDAEVIEDPALWYILAKLNNTPIGFFLFQPRTPILWEFHTVMPLNAKAMVAMQCLLENNGWLWKNTKCQRAETFVPSSNPIALRFGKRAGLKVFGVSPKSYLKEGILRDRILLGVSRPEEN